MNEFGNLLSDYASGKRGAKCSHPISAVYSAEDGSDVCGLCGATLKPTQKRTYTEAELRDAIAAAVQAEREANDEWVSQLINVWNTGNLGKVNVMLEEKYAAIRARNGAGK